MYSEIAGAYRCGKGGAALTGWQSKDLRDDGDDIEPLLQTVTLNTKVSGGIHTHHAACGHSTEYAIVRGVIVGRRERHALASSRADVSD